MLLCILVLIAAECNRSFLGTSILVTIYNSHLFPLYALPIKFARTPEKSAGVVLYADPPLCTTKERRLQNPPAAALLRPTT